MRPIAPVVLSCALLALAPAAHAADSVEARLKAQGIEFETDKDGDYRIVYHYKDDGRTQMVFVGGATETVDGFKVREVFAPAGDIEDDKIDGAMALKLLAESRKAKIGSWELSGRTLLYVIKLPDTVDGKTLESALQVAATQADRMETQLSGDKDAY